MKFCTFLLFSLTLVLLAQPSEAAHGPSCREIHERHPIVPNGVYWVQPEADQPAFQVYCDMRSGGWTLVANAPERDKGALQPSRRLITPQTTGRLTDVRLEALLAVSSEEGNNVRVKVRDAYPAYHISMATPTHVKGSYNVQAQANGFCAAHQIGPDEASYAETAEWSFTNGSGTGAIGFSEAQGFHYSLCEKRARACGESFEPNACGAFLRGSLWVR